MSSDIPSGVSELHRWAKAMRIPVAALLAFSLCGCSLFAPSERTIYVGAFDAVQGEDHQDSIVINADGWFSYQEDENREEGVISGGRWWALGSRVWLDFTIVGDAPGTCVVRVREEGDGVSLELVSQPKGSVLIRAKRFSKQEKGKAQPGATDNPGDAQ